MAPPKQVPCLCPKCKGGLVSVRTERNHRNGPAVRQIEASLGRKNKTKHMRASLDLNDPVATGQSVPADIANRGQPSDLEDIVMQDFRDEEQELEPRGDNHDVST